MSAVTTRVSTERDIRIPPELVAELGLKPGEEIQLVVIGGTLRVARVRKLVDLYGSLKDHPRIADLEGLRDREDEV